MIKRKYNDKPNQTSFKKGHILNVGRKCKEATKKKIGLANSGENNGMWVGDNGGILTIHRRIEKLLGRPSYCEICKKTDKKKYEWSNKDHKYSLRKEDWQRLCTSCHTKFDIEFNNHQVFGRKVI